VKIYNDGTDESFKMLWAFNGMRHLQRDYQERIVGNSHLYELLKGKYKNSEKTRQKMSTTAMGHIVTDETRNKISKKRKEMYADGTLELMVGENNPMYGMTMSDEHKEKIREANKNKVYTEEMKLIRSELSSNKIHINDGVDGKFVTKDEFTKIWEPKGWKLGMKPRKKKS
jgi:hypothetical protein